MRTIIQLSVDRLICGHNFDRIGTDWTQISYVYTGSHRNMFLEINKLLIEMKIHLILPQFQKRFVFESKEKQIKTNPKSHSMITSFNIKTFI